VVDRLAALFSTPAKQALGWTGLGLLGIGLAAIGVLFLTSGNNPAPPAQVVLAPTSGATATAIRVVTPTATSTPPPTPSPSPSPTATTTPPPAGRSRDSSGAVATATPPPAPPTPTPTAAAVVAGGPYCPGIDQSTPPNTVIGLFTIGGKPAPMGTAVTLAFDGVPGPTGNSGLAAGGYHIDYAAGGGNCANRVGSVITVIYNGVPYPTGHKVGDSPGGPIRVDIAAP